MAPRLPFQSLRTIPKFSLTAPPNTSIHVHCHPTTSYPPDRRRPISTYGYIQAKALVYPSQGSPKEVLSLHTHSLAPPHSNLVNLRTLAAPLNPADINQIQGTYPALPPFTTTLGTPTPTAIPGNEACFEVLSAGQSVKTVKVGDWVIPARTGLGTWRTHLQCSEEKVMRVDKSGLSATQVGSVSVNPVTAWQMLKGFGELNGERGDWFVQNGANSGVGRAAIQFGKRWGLRSIAIVRSREGKEGEELRRQLEELGATKVVTEEEILSRDFSDRVKEWTNGGKDRVGLALNCVGGKASISMARCLSSGATMVTYGAMSKSPMAIPASMLIFKDVRFTGFWVSKWGDTFPELKRGVVDEVLGLMREGLFKDGPVVECPWGWESKEEELVEAVEGTLGGFRKGKGVFVFGDT